MINYPLEKRNKTEGAINTERKNIDMLNEALGDIELTPQEESSLIWLCGWETSTLKNIISAFKKSKNEVK